MSKAYIMVGLPASGKSTHVASLLEQYPNAYVYSTDAKLEEIARRERKTYSEVLTIATWKKVQKECQNEVSIAIKEKRDVIWDQTNLSARVRTARLRKFTPDYEKIAIVLVVNPKECKERMLTRGELTGKRVKPDDFDWMVETFEFPTIEEGFTHIKEV